MAASTPILHHSSLSGIPAERISKAALVGAAVCVDVAAADKQIDEEELAAFISACTALKNPLLRALLEVPEDEQRRRIDAVRDVRTRLTAMSEAGHIFRAHPEGSGATRELHIIARTIAKADGVVDDSEKRILALIDAGLSGQRRRSHDIAGSLTWAALGLLVVGGVIALVMAVLSRM